MGRWRRVVAWLPSDAGGPLPSDERIAPVAGRRAERLRAWYVDTLTVGPSALHHLFAGCGRKESSEWQFGADISFWRRVHELAASLVARQQFVPGVLELKKGYWLAAWHPVYGIDDLERMELLARAMPLAARALSHGARRPPASAPRWSVTGAVKDVADIIVKHAENRHAVWETLVVRDDDWRKEVALDDRWVEALLSPGMKIQSGRRDLEDFALTIAEWRVPLYRQPKLEADAEIVPIGLPSSGEGFWDGRKLPGPVECPEIPRTPAAILRRVGDFPDWQGEQPLCDSLIPVYEAASCYALESVFGGNCSCSRHRESEAGARAAEVASRESDVEIHGVGFILGGLLCLVSAVLKLTIGVHWSWWRVLLPLLVMVGHALLDIGVAFTWLAIMGGEGAKVRESRWVDFYQPAALLCMAGFVDNLLRRVGPGESAWFWLASGRIEVILFFGVLSLGFQFLFWWQVVDVDRGEPRG